MPEAYELSPQQRLRWRERISPWFGHEPTLTDLARKGGFSEKNLKTTAGYLGELREGRARALRYFLGEPARLRGLGLALGVGPDRVEALWREVREQEVTGGDTVFLPGFEDWGAVALDDGFVVPPLEGAPPDVDASALRETFLKRVEGGVRIRGARGSGVTTLLRRLASWAAEDGWRVTWGASGALPTGRAELLVLDVDVESDRTRVDTWRKERGHAVLAWTPGLPAAPAPTGGPIAIRLPGAEEVLRHAWSRGELALAPVDEAWLARLLDTVRRRAPRGEARRLSLRPAQLAAILSQVPQPTPEVVGAFVRALVDGMAAEPGRDGVRLVADAARRRLRGNGQREAELALRGAETWLGAAYLRAVDDPATALHDVAELALLRRARVVIDEVHASAEQREVLRSVFPIASAGAAIDALRDAGVLADAGSAGERFRFEPLLAAAVAAEVLRTPALLRDALVDGRTELLTAVTAAPGGPEALAAELLGCAGPILATVIADLELGAGWLPRVRWRPELLARVAALLVATGRAGLARPSRQGKGKTRPRLGPTLEIGEIDALPTVAAVRDHLARLGDELGIPLPAVRDAELASLLARISPKHANLTDPTIWDEDALYAPWIEVLAESVGGLVFLTDVTASLVAQQVLMRAEPEAQAMFEERPQRQHVVWLPLVERLAKSDANACVGVLVRTIRFAIDQTRTHRDTEEYKPTPWKDLVANVVSALAAAAESPVLRRATRGLRDALRAELPGWRGLAEVDDVPVDPWLRDAIGEAPEDLSPLARLLRTLLTPEERVAELRISGDRVTPFWRPVLEAGVPIGDALALYEEVAAGRRTLPVHRESLQLRFVWRRRRGNDPEALPRPANHIWSVLVAHTPQAELGRIPEIPAWGSGATLDDEWLVCFDRGQPDLNNVRRYLWGFVTALDEESLLWRFLARDSLFATAYEDLRGMLDSARLRRRRWYDVADLGRIVSLVPSATLPPGRWEQLANAALLTGLDGPALLPLLQNPVARLARPPLLVAVLAAVRRDNARAVDDWFREALRSDPAAVDHADLAPLLAEAPEAELLDALDRLPANRAGGEGLLAALGLRGVDRFETWLADDRTRDAALGLLARTSGGDARLTEALVALDAVPAASVLAWLIGPGADTGWPTLDALAERWDPARRAELWRAALAVATTHEQRTAGWRRLARGVRT